MTDPHPGAAAEAVNLAYSAGTAVALVAPGCALVFADTPSGAAVARCWPLVRDRVGVAPIVEALLSDALLAAPLLSDPPVLRAPSDSPVQGALRSLPGFALACADEGGTSVVLRAPGRALVSPAAGAPHWLSADGLATWVECRLGIGTTAVTIGVGDDVAAQSPTQVGLALVGGTVLAGSVTMFLGSTSTPEPLAMAAPAVEPWSATPMAAAPMAAAPMAATVPSPDSTISVSVTASVTVQAVACPYGHLGPPYEPYCRICGTAIEDPRSFLAERPPLGLLRLSTGDVVPLDRGVIMGRNPRGTDGQDAARPHLVRLPSPDNDVSRTHVEVRLADWHVLVVDLGSTNGTTVTIPGHSPIRLRAHEPMPLEPNAEVNLADEIVFRYEVPTG